MELKENHILIGLGGTGGKILKAFRKRMFQEYSAEKRAMLPIGYLYVDSSNEMMESVIPLGECWEKMLALITASSFSSRV